MNRGRSHWLWAIALCILLGICLRWLNLGEKVFWHDEVFTALRVTGHMGTTASESLFTGKPITAATILQYQTFAPESTFRDTWRSLIDHPEHPPLFYLLCWAWVKTFGTSIADFRGVAALSSTLTFLALPLLAGELFTSTTAIVFTPLLFAFSPVHLLYAQEARPYALWTLLIVLATWALRRAIRLESPQAWAIYAICLSLTFYTSVLSVLVAIAHGIGGLLALPTRRWRSLGAAIAGAVFLFLPWLMVIGFNYERLQSATAWTTEISYPLSAMVKLWGLHFTAVFIDPGLPLSHPYSWMVPPLVVLSLLAILITLWSALPGESSWPLLMLILVPILLLIGGDLGRGSILSVHTRYFMPALMGALVAVAGWLAWQYPKRPRLVVWGVALIVGLGLACSLAIAQAPTWWSKVTSYPNRAIAEAIQSFEEPVILTQSRGTTLGEVISLSHELPAQTQFVITFPPDMPEVPEGTKTVLLFQPSEELSNHFACAPEGFPGLGELFWVPCEPAD